MENPKTQRTPQGSDKYVLRMPDGMRDKLGALAKANNRSMNAEIVLILQHAIEGRTLATEDRIDIDALAEALAARLKIKLEHLSD